MRPPEAVGDQRGRAEGQHDEAQRHRQPMRRQLIADLGEPAGDPPARPPHQREPRNGSIHVDPAAQIVDHPARHQARCGKNHRAEEELVGDRQRILRVGEGLQQVPEEGGARNHLQEAARGHGQHPGAPAADPNQQTALGRPHDRREMGVECQRHRDHREGDPEPDVGLRQRAALPPEPVGDDRQRAVHQHQGGRAHSHAVVGVADGQVLEAEPQEGRAEHQRRRRRPSQIGRLPDGEQHRYGQVQQDQHRDERLHVGPLVLVEAPPQPEGRDPECEAEAQKVELGPSLVPGDCDDGRAQHRIEAEHRDVIFGARVGQHRGQEPADDAEHREGRAVLGDGQEPGAHRHRDHRHRRGGGRKHVEDREGGVGREIQHGHTAALEAEPVERVLAPQPPADGQQRQPEQRHRDEAHLDGERDDASAAGLPQQQPHPDQRHQHTHLDGSVAGGDPLLDRADEPGERIEGRPRGRDRAGRAGVGVVGPRLG